MHVFKQGSQGIEHVDLMLFKGFNRPCVADCEATATPKPVCVYLLW